MRNRIFWGSVLILLGLAFLISYQVGLSIWNLLWPFAIIVLGGWLLLLPYLAQGIEISKEELSIPMDDTKYATLKIEHGAGSIRFTTDDLHSTLLKGSFMGGIDSKVSSSEGKRRVKLQSKVEFMNFLPRFQKDQRLLWDVVINKSVPMKIKMETGASDNYLDLRKSQLKELHLETGASTTEIFLPEEAGETGVRIESGASTIRIHIPQTVAAKIKIGGLIGKAIDTKRFIKEGDLYQSSGYADAANRAEIDIESGVGSIEID